MKKSTKVGLYILAGGAMTALQVAKRFCKIRAREGRSKLYIVMDNAFDFVGNWIENIVAVSMVVGMFI